MNTTKRKLELGSAIVGIVLYAILSLLYLLALVGASFLNAAGSAVGGQEGAAAAALSGALMVLTVFCLVFSVAGIVLGALLCKKPKQNADGAYSNRLGLTIAFIVLNAILFILECINVAWLGIIAVAVILALAIASVCMKHKAPEAAAVTETPAAAQDELK